MSSQGTADLQDVPDVDQARYIRNKPRGLNDMTYDEWALVKPQVSRAKRGGHKRTMDVCEVANELTYLLSTGCRWRMLTEDLSPHSAMQFYLCRCAPGCTLRLPGNTLSVCAGL